MSHPRSRHGRLFITLVVVTTLLAGMRVGDARAGTSEPTADVASLPSDTSGCIGGWLQRPLDPMRGAALDGIWDGSTPWIVGFDDGAPPTVRGFAARWTGS